MEPLLCAEFNLNLLRKGYSRSQGFCSGLPASRNKFEKRTMMGYLVEQFGVFPGWLLGSLAIFARYLFFAGPAFLFFYIWFREAYRVHKIQPLFPDRRHWLRELRHSAATALVFALVFLLIYWMRMNGHTHIYLRVSDYGWAYLVVSFWILVFVHDTYFYWAHRLMHTRRLFPMLHRVHHLSHNPTPLATLSFHPLEAFLEIAIVPVLVFFIPLHPLVLFLFATWSLLFNVLGHLGYEISPKGFVEHPFWKWFNTPTHHNMHHSKVNCNYGLYFNLWDRLMGTNHEDYIETFNAIKKRSRLR